MIDNEIRKIAYKPIKINEKYRFINSNYKFDDNIIPFLKHDEIVSNLKNRIKFSNGGSFLITGLRGVGKSTLVKRALNELNIKCITCLPVYISLSKNIKFNDLLFEIIRRLFESIIDNKVFDKLNNTVKNDIVLSYSRTSMSISHSNSLTSEVATTMSNNSILGNIFIKNKLTHQAAEEATFLAYSESDIEHDLCRIIELLNNDSKKYKVVIVFDELDKLTANESGVQYFESVLCSLKNFLCSANAISIFVGGLDLYEKWNDDTAKINSLYDSIFCWHQYVPCIWDSTESLLTLIEDKQYVYERVHSGFKYFCESDYTNIIKKPFKQLLTYISFRSKGIPRKIYSEFNNLIVWNNDNPHLLIKEMDIIEIYAYSEIWKKISTIFEEKLYKTIIEMDLTFTVCFTMIEYFSSHVNEKFTLDKIKESMLYENILNELQMDGILTDLLQRFVEQYIIIKSDDESFFVSDATIKRDDKNIAIKDKAIYQNTQIDHSDAASINNISHNSANEKFNRRIDRYDSDNIRMFWRSFKAEELITRNADMEIYYVKNNFNQKHFNALLFTDIQLQKFIDKKCLYDENIYKITSKYLLDTTDIVDHLSIKTSLREIYQGYLLSHIIESHMRINCIMLITEQLINFIIELNEQGYFNANIKANNIMVNELLNIKILDIKNVIRLNTKGIPISSLGYAAPEMYTEDYDHRCDIYSIGVLLWEMITCNLVSKIKFERHIQFLFLKKPKKCSIELWKIIIKATNYYPNERYKNAKDFLDNLHQCKEYKRCMSMVSPTSVGTVTNLFVHDSNVHEENPLNRQKISINDRTQVHMNDNKQNVNLSSSGETTALAANRYDTNILSIEKKQSLKADLLRIITNEIIEINKPTFLIGKDLSCADYCISNNRAISRVHAKIIVKNNKYYLCDQGSCNGTYLNSEKIQANVETEIKDNDKISLANEDFIFHIKKSNNDIQK